MRGRGGAVDDIEIAMKGEGWQLWDSKKKIAYPPPPPKFDQLR